MTDYDANKPEEAGVTAEDFLPDDYEVPSAEGGYMKFEQGDNKFRILASPILGWEYWNEDKEGNRKPVRFRMDEKIDISELDEPEGGKHFWAMPVWNFKTKRVQILEITQKGIQKKLRALTRDKEWGTPLGYNITVIREGDNMMNTEYEVIPSPHSKAPVEAVKQLEEMNLNLEALFDGEDPFGGKK